MNRLAKLMELGFPLQDVKGLLGEHLLEFRQATDEQYRLRESQKLALWEKTIFEALMRQYPSNEHIILVDGLFSNNEETIINQGFNS